MKTLWPDVYQYIYFPQSDRKLVYRDCEDVSFESECARHRSGCLPQGRPSCSLHLKNRPEGTALTKMREGLRTSNHGFLLTPNEASLKKNKSLKIEKKKFQGNRSPESSDNLLPVTQM